MEDSNDKSLSAFEVFKKEWPKLTLAERRRIENLYVAETTAIMYFKMKLWHAPSQPPKKGAPCLVKVTYTYPDSLADFSEYVTATFLDSGWSFSSLKSSDFEVNCCLYIEDLF